MSAPSSIKLLKLGASNSHFSTGRLSTVVRSVTSKFGSQNGHAAVNRAVCRSDQYTNRPADRQPNDEQNATQTDREASEQLATCGSAVSSIDFLSTNFASLPHSPVHDQPATNRPARARSATMGSSSSKCAKITDQSAACPANQAGWLSAHCHSNLPPQLNQPFLHHSCSMINLTDCACCHSSFSHHDGE